MVVMVGVSVHTVFFMCDENVQNSFRKGEIGKHMGEKSDSGWRLATRELS